MRTSRVAARAVRIGLGMVCLLAASGCGILIDFSSSPDQVGVGQDVNFTLTLTNPSRCPVGEVQAVVIPFLTASQINSEGGEISAFLNLLCDGSQVNLPDGVVCRIEMGQLICEVPTAETAPGTSGSLQIDSPFGSLKCRHEGSTLTCDLPNLDQASSGLNASLLPPGVLPCMPLGSPTGEICALATLAPGASVTATFSFPAPPHTGLLRNLAFAGAGEQGICKTGTNAGTTCDEDTDCSGVVGSCASHICINNTTQTLGAGCDTNGDCGENESCVSCEPDVPGVILPIACTETAVAPLAPSVSTAGMAAAILTLLSLGFFGLLRLRRR